MNALSCVLISVSLFIFNKIERIDSMCYDVVIIGGGIIGGMIARELSKYKLNVCILEKENDVSCGATKANSGIIHGGYDPIPGTLKARLNAEGVPLIYKAAYDLNVPVKNNEALVCAFTLEEKEHLKELYFRGIDNGIDGLSIISGDEVRSIEPNVSSEVIAALYVKNSGIISPYELCIAAIGNAMDNGVELIRNFEVNGINKQDNKYQISSVDNKAVSTEYVINCAGCYSDKIAAMVGDFSFEIIPRAGEYMLLDKEEGGFVSRTIFQVPTSSGKGILVTPTAEGNLLVGPTAEKVDTPSSTYTTNVGIKKVKEGALKSAPKLRLNKVITSFCGVRSSVETGDFIIEESQFAEKFINVAAIDSPGLTASVAIAQYVVDILKNKGLELSTNIAWNGKRENLNKFRNMSVEDKDIFIKNNPSFGKIICRCEGVSEGEILAALRNNPKALDVDAVKRRTRSGMGRCQGGFCMPYIMKLLAEENMISLNKVTKKGKGSEFVFDKL